MHTPTKKSWGEMTFTDELQEIVAQTAPLNQFGALRELSADERMLRECALRLLALKHGGTWNDAPVVGDDGR